MGEVDVEDTQGEDDLNEKPSPLDLLLDASHAETAALLKTNEFGVQQYFSSRGCERIGKALCEDSVTGSNLHMMTDKNIEHLPLNIGEKLALKRFIDHIKRSSTIWEGEEFGGDSMSEEFPGLLPGDLFDGFDGFDLCTVLGCEIGCEIGCDEKEEGKQVELPQARYELTNNTLKIITSEWGDGYPADEDRFVDDDFEQPQIMTTTRNIDLLAVEDVDNIAHSAEKKTINSGCFDGLCFGYKQKEHVEPAEVIVSYRDKTRGQKEPPQQVRLKVEASVVADVTEKIIASRNDLVAECK